MRILAQTFLGYENFLKRIWIVRKISLGDSVVNQLAKPGRKLAKQQLIVSLLVTLCISIFLFFYLGVTASLSALAGGFVSILPYTVFAAYSFRYAGASKTEQVYASIKRGNAIKFLLTICLFALVFKYFTVMAMPFFCCYILVTFSQWAAPIFFNY